MHTICPGCMTRLSDRARFCHHCATPIRPDARAGTRTDVPCPSCEGDDRVLNSRPVEGAVTEVLECPRCTGLWITRAILQSLVTRARGDTKLADQVRDQAFAVMHSTAEKQSSIWQDGQRGRQT